MRTILGLDYGTKRIGLAVSDPSAELALPVRSVEIDGEEQALQVVAEEVADRGADSVVIGLPLNMDGSKGPMAEKVEAFARRLSERTGVPVVPHDERLTTWSVEQTLIEADVSRRKRKGVRDKLAAQAILQSYLDGLQNAIAGAHLPPVAEADDEASDG